VTLTGAVDLTTATGGDATIVNTGAVTLAASNIGGDLSVTAATGDVTVSDQLVAGGTTGIDLTATTGNIALGDVDGLLTANGGGAVSLRADSGAITVAAASSSNAEIVATDVDLRARAIGATNPLDVRGATALSITDTGAGTIRVREVGFHTLSDTTLAVTAADAGTLGVEYFNDAGSLSALTSGGTTTLSSAGSGVMSNLTLTTAGAINFAATHVTGFLDATATTGNITDSFALSVVGTSSFTTVASGADIDLDLVTLTGAVDLTTAAGGDVSLESASDIKVNDIVTSGDVTLTSTSGNNVTIQNAIGDGANPINTLTVTANQISMGDVTSNGLQTYRGKVVLTQDAALEASPGSGDAVIFTDTVDGPASLAIIADGNVQFDADIGATTRLDSFAVQVAAASNGLVRFAKPVGGTQVLLAENDIWLNSNGRTPSTVSNHGTLVRSVDGHLTIDSENGDVTMGQGERLSVPGNLILNAGPVSGTATLADLTALQIGVSAFDVTLLLRAPSPVELVDTSIVQDSGVDVVANRISIDVLNPNDTMTLDGTGTATFGVEHQPGTGHNELTLPANFSSTSSQGSVQLTAIKRDSTPITTGEILRSSDNLVLDGIPLGANRQVLFVSGLIPVLPEPPEPPEVGPAPPKKEEVMAWMQCAQLEEGDEIPEICAEGAGGAGDFDSETFQDSSALGVLQLYRALVRSSATIERIRPAFQAAIHSYREQANSGQVLGKVFRKFLGESAGHEEAGGYLEQFEFLFGQLKMLNLLPNDYAATRDELLIEVLEELELTGLATVEGLGAIFIPSDIPDVEAPTA
jgi:hypothetical protein